MSTMKPIYCKIIRIVLITTDVIVALWTLLLVLMYIDGPDQAPYWTEPENVKSYHSFLMRPIIISAIATIVLFVIVIITRKKGKSLS